MTPDQYCTDYVADTGSNLYYGLMFAPTERRRAASAVYAFARAIGDIAEEFKDPGVAQAKFQWWREELVRTWSGVARHPITQALAPFVSTHHLSHTEFLSFVDASQENLDAGRYANFATLRMHVLAIGGLPSWLAAQTFGARHSDTRRYAETLGIALRLTEIVNDLGRDLRRHRLYIPLEDLHRFKLDETDLFTRQHNPAFTKLMAFQIERASRHFDDADNLLPNNERLDQLPGLTLAEIGRAQLREIRREGYRVLDQRLVLTPLRKLWLAWKTRAREQRRARRSA